MRRLGSGSGDKSVRRKYNLVLLAFFVSLALIWGNMHLTVYLKTYNCIVITQFQHTKLYSFENPGFRYSLWYS